MAKLGTKQKPVMVRVKTQARAMEIVQVCKANGWQFIMGLEPDKPEDISDLQKLLHPPAPIKSTKVGRNDPCPCGSGKKYKKCCGLALRA
jgi:Predicted metal-binding protein related to the C-terminal domain of SecA